MNTTPITQELSKGDLTQLQREVERYLAAVDAFRAEGSEPAPSCERSPTALPDESCSSRSTGG